MKICKPYSVLHYNFQQHICANFARKNPAYNTPLVQSYFLIFDPEIEIEFWPTNGWELYHFLPGTEKKIKKWIDNFRMKSQKKAADHLLINGYCPSIPET